MRIGEGPVGILRQPQSSSELQDQVAQLFADTREDLYRSLLTLGVHPPKAQESVQEVFLRLYTTLKKGEKIENIRGWLFRVAARSRAWNACSTKDENAAMSLRSY